MFGVRNGDVRVQDYHRIVMNGLQLHGVVGRRIFDTWKITSRLLEDKRNGIHDKIFNIILNKGRGVMTHIDQWTQSEFEEVINTYPKPLIEFSS